MTTLILAALLIAAQLETAPQPPAGTGIIRGRVTDGETGEPIPRALVSLHLGTTTRDALTGPDGRYEFTNVPAGPWMVSAVGGEFRATHLRGFAVPAGGGRWPPMKDGEVRTGADIALPRARAISGRVTGASGEPLARLQVRLKPVGAGHAFVMTASTDDRGAFRIFGVEPGRYYVCVDGASPGASLMRSAERLERYVATCHPSATSEADAVAVRVAETDVEGVEIRMLRSRTYTIQGSVLDAAGQPASAVMVGLEQATADGTTNSATLAATGQFTFSGVTPGRYTLVAQPSGPYVPGEPRERQAGYAFVEVDADDLRGVVIAVKPASRLAGRVTFEGTPPPFSKEGRPFAVEIRRDRTRRAAALDYPDRAVVTKELTFELSGVFGPLRLAVSNPPDGWMLESVRYRGSDITDVLTEFPPGSSDVEVVLTDRGAVLTGSVVSEGSVPLPGVRVVLFPADPARWQDTASHEVTARTAKDGRFTHAPRRPGDYLVIALEALTEIPATITRALFERMAHAAERVTLLDADRRTIDLRVVTLPEDRR